MDKILEDILNENGIILDDDCKDEYLKIIHNGELIKADKNFNPFKTDSVIDFVKTDLSKKFMEH